MFENRVLRSRWVAPNDIVVIGEFPVFVGYDQLTVEQRAEYAIRMGAVIVAHPTTILRLGGRERPGGSTKPGGSEETRGVDGDPGVA